MKVQAKHFTVIIIWNFTDCTSQGLVPETENIGDILNMKGFIIQILCLENLWKAWRCRFYTGTSGMTLRTIQNWLTRGLPSEVTTWMVEFKTTIPWMHSRVQESNMATIATVSAPQSPGNCRRNTEGTAVQNKTSHFRSRKISKRNRKGASTSLLPSKFLLNVCKWWKLIHIQSCTCKGARP